MKIYHHKKFLVRIYSFIQIYTDLSKIRFLIVILNLVIISLQILNTLSQMNNSREGVLNNLVLAIISKWD